MRTLGNKSLLFAAPCWAVAGAANLYSQYGKFATDSQASSGASQSHVTESGNSTTRMALLYLSALSGPTAHNASRAVYLILLSARVTDFFNRRNSCVSLG
jgi:hypothetical protein